MTLAELFIKIGFKVDNQASFDKAVGQLGIGEVKAINLKHAVVGLGASFTALMYFAANAATGLYKFHLNTGLSTKSLQEWEYAGRRANVAAGQVQGAIESIQDAQAQIALGQGNVAPWALLGIDPRQDPFQVLLEIHKRIKETGGIAPVMGRYLTSQMGISEDMFQFLRRDNLELGQLKDKFVQTDKEQKSLDELNGRWGQMRYQIEQIGIKFADLHSAQILAWIKEMAPWIEKAATWLAKLAENTPDGERQRAEYQKWAKGIMEVVVALIALEAAAKVVATLTAVGTVVKAIATTAAGAGGGAAAGGAGGGPAGGAGAAGAGAEVVGATGLSAGLLVSIVGAIPFWILALKSWADDRTRIEGRHRGETPAQIEKDVDQVNMFKALKRLFIEGGQFGDNALSGGMSRILQNVNITQHIDGSKDPIATGQAAAAATKKAMIQANTSFVDQSAIGAIAH